MEYVGEKRKIDEKIVLNNLSEYAYNSYNKHRYSEVFAESLASEDSNNLINEIVGLIDKMR